MEVFIHNETIREFLNGNSGIKMAISNCLPSPSSGSCLSGVPLDRDRDTRERVTMLIVDGLDG